MVDRIDKLKTGESWKIQETNPSKQDKRNKSDEEKQEEAKSSFEEKPDWNHWIAKESKGAGNLLTRNVKDIHFKHSPTSLNSPRGKEAADTALQRKNILNLNKSEFFLMLVTGILLMVLIFLIIKFFI